MLDLRNTKPWRHVILHPTDWAICYGNLAVIIYLQICPLKSPSVTSDIGTDLASSNSGDFFLLFRQKTVITTYVTTVKQTVRGRRGSQQLSHSAVLPLPSPRSALPARSPLSSAAMFSCSTDREFFFLLKERNDVTVVRPCCKTLDKFTRITAKYWGRCLKLTAKNENYEQHKSKWLKCMFLHTFQSLRLKCMKLVKY